MIKKAILLGLLFTVAFAPAFAQAPGPAVRGAPLGGATPESDTAAGDPIRLIPESSWDLLEQMESDADVTEFKPAYDNEHLKVPFGAIAGYEYTLVEPSKLRAADDPQDVLGNQIPNHVQMLDDQKTLMVGFMVPIDVDRKGNVTAFALTQNQSFCCYGVPPAINELVMVEMAEGKTAPYAYDTPVAVFGTMHVGEEIDDGYVLSLYRVTSNEVIDARELLRRQEKARQSTDD